MNERERVEFNIVVGHLYKNLGNELLRNFRPGIEYYRDLEGKVGSMVGEISRLEHEVRRLERENAALRASSASTVEIQSPVGYEGGSRRICRKNENCANWEPEPQTPGEGSGVVGTALIRDEDKHPTDRVEPVGEKKSFFAKIFGG